MSPLILYYTYMSNFISISVFVWEEFIPQKVPLNLFQKCIFGNIAKKKIRDFNIYIYINMHITEMYFYTKFHVNWSISVRDLRKNCINIFLAILPKIQYAWTCYYIWTLTPLQCIYLPKFMLISLNIRTLGWVDVALLRRKMNFWQYGQKYIK